MARQATMTVKELQWIRSIHWDNEHTRMISAALGDERACVGFDPTATLDGKARSLKVGCWLFARICKVKLTGPGTGPGDFAVTPRVWWPWRDLETKHPLPIHDPRVMGWWRQSDQQRTGENHTTKQREAVAANLERVEDQKARNIGLMLKDDFKVFKRLGDQVSGFTGKEKGGGARRFFYPNCLPG